uniref:Uncharacterized protein n=1 Tax=viral metagenome TaxID=1070528 RepID=A0A6C0AQY0_9ZZZZ
MLCLLINGVKYIYLSNANDLKYKSLSSNVYFTLRDIFWNGDTNQRINVNNFNSILINNSSLEERGKVFEYSDALYDYNSCYTKKLYNWLSGMTKDNIFDFDKLEDGKEIDMSEYMIYDDWWDQFLNLHKKLEEQLEKHKKWEAEDIERDFNRVAETMGDENY